MNHAKAESRRPHNPSPFALRCAFTLCLSLFTPALHAADTYFSSPALGKDLPCKITEPPNPESAPTVIYLQNLSIPRIGTDTDDAILHDLRNDGDRVVVIDYAHDPNAVSPKLNADMLQLRSQIFSKKFLADRKVDQAHIYILAEGFRLKRDVPFYTAGSRTLAMDILYPAHPKSPVPALMEITCDNANRMGNFSIVFCHDTLIEGGELAGFAGAMIDHPIAPPYKGLDDPMPQSIAEMKSAVRTLRFEGKSLGLNGNIGAIGFSRGSEWAAILAVTNESKNPSLEGDAPPGLHKDVSSNVQAALIHGARYDLSAITPDDPMYKRFEKAWGTREDNPEKWAAHGPAYYLPKDPAAAKQSVAPMFLNTSDKESNEFRNGLLGFSKRLDDLHADHTLQLDHDGRGHHVSTDPATLSRIYTFFTRHLNP
ncbi:MAG: hypothetical protein ACTHN5_15090 [Phycisphaerae bacterium]